MYFNFNIEELNIENIFNKISDIDVYEFYLGHSISSSKKYTSPFREDNNPSLSFIKSNKTGRVLWRDWGDSLSTKPAWVIDFVMRLFNCSFYQALSKLNIDFNLGLNGEPDTNIRRFVSATSINKVKKPSEIHIEKRMFNKEDVSFWEQFGISLKTLSLYNVCAVSSVWIDALKHVKTKASEPMYAYQFFLNGIRYYKIYSPFSVYKWISNCSSNVIQGYDQLSQEGDLLIITKSLKDVMSLKELGYNSIAPQSETAYLNNSLIESLSNRFNKIILFYDNDKTGIEKSKENSERFGFKTIMIPLEYEVKDISDFIKKYKKENAKNLLNSIL